MKSFVVIAALLLAAPALAEPDDTYVIQPGDTCLGISIGVLGDRDALAKFHALNPQLGPLPHNLVPGSVVKLPPHAPEGADAQLTRTAGDVKFRPPSTAAWSEASRGMQLFRAWRIGAADRASAELMFRNDSVLGMRERTIVVIYGPEKRQAKVITATADLEEGALEARLGKLDGKPVVVRTPAAQADLRDGDVLVTTQPTGASIVANHRGAPVAVRGRAPKAGAVAVPQGMGSRVPAGGSPEPPRPLPPVPLWATPVSAWAAVGAPTAQVQLAWAAVGRAQTYRVVVHDASGDFISATPVAVPARTLDLALAPGAYTATVAAIDADGFESAPSPPLALEVAAGALVPVGAAQPLAVPATKIAAGSTFVAPAGWSCGAGAEAPAAKVQLLAAGPTTIRCVTASGVPAAPFEVEVTAVALVTGATSRGELVARTHQAATFTFDVASGGAVGDGLALEVSPELHATVTRVSATSFQVVIAASATAARGTVALRYGGAQVATRDIVILDEPAPIIRAARPAPPWSAGAFGGLQLLDVGKPADLGNPPRPPAALSHGALVGARVDWMPRYVGAQLELGFGRPGHADGPDTATTLVAKAHAVLGYRQGPGRLALLAGGGVQSVIHANGGSVRDTDPVFDWGAMFGVAARGVLLRFDVRHTLFAASGGGVAQGLELSAGLSFELPR